MTRGAALGLCLHLLSGGPARAEAVFTGKVSLTAMYYAESDGAASPTDASATTAALAYGDLRVRLEGKRLWRDRLDLRLDVRLRLTGGLDFERKYSADAGPGYASDPNQSLGVSARGYLGGPEYDLREAYGLLRLGERTTLQLGRMHVREADALRVDGARLLRPFGERWEGSVFLGGAPNPYSRSLLSDYQPPCGAGVAGARDAALTQDTPCVSGGAQFGGAVGVTARYSYPSIWGALGLVGTVYAGAGDGGPVRADPAGNAGQPLLPPLQDTDAPRVYVSWMTSWRPLDRLDVFVDAVVDLYGGGGPQLTRLVSLGTLRLLRGDRLTLRLGYTHLSSLAVNMYLNRMLYNRLSGVTLGAAAAAVENNLTVLRTGRDEGRLTADVKVWRRLGAFVDARVRARSLLGGDGDPAVYGAPVYTDNTRALGGDVSVGLREGGTFGGVRAGLSYTALLNFRANNHVIALDLGRDFWNERLSLDLNYVAALTTDAGAGAAAAAQAAGQAVCKPDTPYLVGCFGQRSGLAHELGLTVLGQPWRKLFVLLDYRLVALLTDAQPKPNDPTTVVEIPTLLSHQILLRTELRW